MRRRSVARPPSRIPLVLYLDDGAARGSLRVEALRGVGLDVVHLRDAMAALVLAEARSPDVVVVDADAAPISGGAVGSKLLAEGVPHVRLASGFFGPPAETAPRDTRAMIEAIARTRTTLTASLGTAARVELFRDGEDMCQARAWDAPPRSRPTGGGSTVLVVDDHADTRDLFVELLAAEGHRVLAASNGHDALVLALAAPLDILFLDVRLPGRSGLDVARAVRDALGARAPFLVATTGDDAASARRDTARSGFDVHLVKPVDNELLLAAMDAARVRASSD